MSGYSETSGPNNYADDVTPQISSSNISEVFTSTLRDTATHHLPNPDDHSTEGWLLDCKEASEVELDNQLDVDLKISLKYAAFAALTDDGEPVPEREFSYYEGVVEAGETLAVATSSWQYEFVEITPQSTPSSGDVTVTWRV